MNDVAGMSQADDTGAIAVGEGGFQDWVDG